MMKPIRPNISQGGSYPREFREEAVRYWLSSGQPLVAVASDLGLSPQCLRNWSKSLESEANSATQGPTSTQSPTFNSDKGNANDLALARENGQLRRELEAMTRQRDILKKAISIFSEDKTVSGGLK